MKKKPIKLGNVLLCDYVAKGENNKFVLVNAYSGRIIVDHFPATIPFGFYCEYLPDNTGRADLLLKIKVGKNLIIEAGVAIDVVEIAPQVIAIANFILTFDNANDIEISISSEGYKDTVALSKNVQLGIIGRASATVSQPLSEQSEPASQG